MAITKVVDYRESIRIPSSPAMSLLDNPQHRNDGKPYPNRNRRAIVEMFCRGYTREEIASKYGKTIHGTAEIIRLAKERLGAENDIQLVLIAYGISPRHGKPLSRFLKVLEERRCERRYCHETIDLLVRGYSYGEIVEKLGTHSRHAIEVTARIAMNKLNMPDWVHLTLLAHDIINGRDFCLREPAR